MFGGVAFLINGNICCSVHTDALMARLAPEASDMVLRKPHTPIFTPA